MQASLSKKIANTCCRAIQIWYANLTELGLVSARGDYEYKIGGKLFEECKVGNLLV